ncbi:PDE1B phosphodiesterase, partial [Grus americana]|nr:PDE1B phosphodiesterase [Grus americana]
LDLWCFDVFALNRVTDDHSLRTIVFELFTRHNLNSRFKIPAVFLTTLLDALETGYGKYRNPYHNQVHAADVTQTVHCFLLRTGMLVRGGGGGAHGGPTWVRGGAWGAPAPPPASPPCHEEGVSPSTPCPCPNPGFIDFIVEPTFSVLTDVAEKMVLPHAEDGTKAKGNPAASQQASSQWRQPSLDEHLELGDIKADLAGFRSTWAKYIQENKQKWKERAASG